MPIVRMLSEAAACPANSSTASRSSNCPTVEQHVSMTTAMTRILGAPTPRRPRTVEATRASPGAATAQGATGTDSTGAAIGADGPMHTFPIPRPARRRTLATAKLTHTQQPDQQAGRQPSHTIPPMSSCSGEGHRLKLQAMIKQRIDSQAAQGRGLMHVLTQSRWQQRHQIVLILETSTQTTDGITIMS